jgi:heme-degrading monooxygenase HmoA
MYARLWEFRVREGRLVEFAESVQSMGPDASQELGFRGVLFMRSRSGDGRPKSMLISLWESRAHLRASDKGMFLPRALGRLAVLCEAHPVIREFEVPFARFLDKKARIPTADGPDT